MRYLIPRLVLAGLAASLLAPPVLAAEQLPKATLFRAAAEAREPGGPLRSAERARYCAQSYPADYYDGWVRNGCTKAPYGPRFEYLASAWRCLCLGHE